MLKTTTIEAQPTFEREKMIYMYIEREMYYIMAIHDQNILKYLKLQ